MARSFARVSDATPIEDYERNNSFFHAASGRHYSVFRRNGRIFQRRYELDAGGSESNVLELEAAFAIGSGNRARTFFHRSDSGELTQLPVTWYTQEGRWGMSPGYDNAAPPDFTRIADESCLFCHNAYPAADGTLAGGIDCQRCHGPGSRHVELAGDGKTATGEVRSAIVNPARLAPERQMDVCMQCHLETTSAELPGMVRRFDRDPFSFRPGEPLGAYMIHFDQRAGAGREDRFEIVNQAYRLRRSQCFRQSRGRLTCTTCHNPHDVPLGEAAVAQYRSKCMGCHNSLTAASHPDPAKSDCASCHMPARRTEDAVHVTMTDHLIARRPRVRDTRKPLVERTAVYRGPVEIYYPETLPEKERDLYVGVASITDSADRQRGIALLEGLAASEIPAKAMAVLGEGYLAAGLARQAAGMFRAAAAKDPSLRKAHYNLGQALEAAGEISQARAAYEQALRTGAAFAEAHHALANLLVKTGELATAKEHYWAAIRLRPLYAEAHNNVANLYADEGRLDEARAALQEALNVNPAYPEAHNNLARVLAARKQIPEALRHARRAVALNPKYVEAHYNLARLLQETGQHAAALAEYRRTLALRPDLVEAHVSLGQALGDEGNLDNAISEFREALRLRPDHVEAKRNLELALELKKGTGH